MAIIIDPEEMKLTVTDVASSSPKVLDVKCDCKGRNFKLNFETSTLKNCYAEPTDTDDEEEDEVVKEAKEETEESEDEESDLLEKSYGYLYDSDKETLRSLMVVWLDLKSNYTLINDSEYEVIKKLLIRHGMHYDGDGDWTFLWDK